MRSSEPQLNDLLVLLNRKWTITGIADPFLDARTQSLGRGRLGSPWKIW